MARPIGWTAGKILCAIAIVLSIIELGLTAYLVDVTNGTSATRNFFLFASIWTLLVTAVALFAADRIPERYSNVPVLLAVEAVTAVFWFASSIAFAAQWGSPHCGGNTYCGTTEAAIAFGFIIFFVYLGIMFFEFRAGHRTTSVV